MIRTISTVLAVLWLSAGVSGCGSGEPEPPKTRAEKEQALRDSSFGAMTGTLDRAQGVEQLQEARKQQLDAAMDEAESR